MLSSARVHNTTKKGNRIVADDDHVTADFGPQHEASAHIYVGPVAKPIVYGGLKIQAKGHRPGVVWYDNKKNWRR